MFHEQQHIIPRIRTSRIKISLVNGKSKLEINRIFIPIESNLSPENIFTNNDKIQTTESSEQEIQSSDDENSLPSSSKIQQIMNTIDHRKAAIGGYNHKQQLQSPSSGIVQQQQISVVPIDLINEHQPSSSSEVSVEPLIISTNKTDSPSSVIQVERSLSPPPSQLMPDSIINDKQATNRIFNSTHFIHPSKFITLTPIDSSEKKPSNSINVRYYQLGSLFTSTSTFIMHQNEVIAHATATATDPFLSDTIFIILIATLTIIILLFCLGLFCLCRRTTKRNISPSFDGGSYAGLNEHSVEIPIDDYQKQISKYENNTPYTTEILPSSIQTRSLIKQPSLTNDRIPLTQPVTLHHTAKQKVKISKNKLKKKRVGFCCCNSKQTPSITANARTQMRSNEM